MAEKRMLIIDAEVADKIDQNRGDMSRSEFLNFLIDHKLKEEEKGNQTDYVTKPEFQHFAEGMKELLRNFLEFFLSYGLELGKEPTDKTFDELSQKLQSLETNAGKARKL